MLEKIFPDVLHTVVEMKVELPPEMRQLLSDMHTDRTFIGWTLVVIAACAVATTFHFLFPRKKEGQ